MLDLGLRITVFRPDGEKEELAAEPAATITLGSLAGCTITVSDQGLFAFTLLSWDRVARCYLLHLTDAMKGELSVDGTTRPLAGYRADGTAQGVECLGLWTMPLPIPCSGRLAVAGITLQFTLETVALRKSTFRPLLKTDGQTEAPDIPTVIRRRRA